MLEAEFVARVEAAGGRAFAVGGWVRDLLRGEQPEDKDYVVTGMEAEGFEAAFPEGKLIGRAFPVFLLPVEADDGRGCRQCEVALARRERKSGSGYRGFAAEAGSSITIEEDLYRRDLTINSMAMDLHEGRLVDPYGGQADIAAGVLRPVSEHFGEDPVRALRAARFAARLGYGPAPELLAAMGQCRSELLQEPGERILGELKKALATDRPSLFFRLLQSAGLLQDIFPEIHALIGKTQPEVYHPEGDAFEHVMLIADEVAGRTDNTIARFAALCHDLGKGVTPESMLPHHYGHEVKGLQVLAGWNRRVTLPSAWLKGAKFIISQHMRAPRLSKAGKICELLLMMKAMEAELSISDIKIIIRADNKGLPPYLERAEEIIGAMRQVSGAEAPARLRGRKIGDWVKGRQLEICRKMLAEESTINKSN